MKNTPRTILIVGTICSLCIGLIGGVVSAHYDATFLLGFLSGFVMTGLITLFVLAARMENDHFRK